MTKNIGTLDRILRFIISGVIAILLLTGILKGLVAIILGIFGFIFLLTGIIGWCGLYAILGISTIEKKNTELK
jgi:hypothetical protein